MTEESKDLGQQGEEIALGLLKREGYEILETNYTTPFGEIDIVAHDHGTVAFVEVKTRKDDRFGPPEEGVTRRKQAQIARVASYYLMEKNLTDQDCRFDVVGVQRTSGPDGWDAYVIQDAFRRRG